jgi:peptide/nickel transport system ATP-binding protein
MYVGKLVEVASSAQLFSVPKHPYTEALLSAVPRPDPKRPIEAMVLEGDVADPANRPSGCCFHPRCRYAERICREEEPPLRRVDDDRGEERFVACHFADQLVLRSMDGTPSQVTAQSPSEIPFVSVSSKDIG